MTQRASGSAPAHKHCPVCGISMAPTKDYCSNECRDADRSNQRRIKNYRRLTLLLMAAAMVVLVGLTLFIRSRG